MGMGRGAAWMQSPPPQATRASLSARAQQLETELKAIQDELKQMGDE
jgi:flagellar hook-associated protein FlgK